MAPSAFDRLVAAGLRASNDSRRQVEAAVVRLLYAPETPRDERVDRAAAAEVDADDAPAGVLAGGEARAAPETPSKSKKKKKRKKKKRKATATKSKTTATKKKSKKKKSVADSAQKSRGKSHRHGDGSPSDEGNGRPTKKHQRRLHKAGSKQSAEHPQRREPVGTSGVRRVPTTRAAREGE